MRVKGFVSIIIVSVIVISIIVFSTRNYPPIIMDKPDMDDEGLVIIEGKESVTFEESQTVSKEKSVTVKLNDKGKKIYVINIIDAPEVSD